MQRFSVNLETGLFTSMASTSNMATWDLVYQLDGRVMETLAAKMGSTKAKKIAEV